MTERAARHAAEGMEFNEETLSLLQSRQRVGGYATAIHEDLATSELEELEDSLFRFARIVASTPELRAALARRGIAVEYDAVMPRPHQASHDVGAHAPESDHSELHLRLPPR